MAVFVFFAAPVCAQDDEDIELARQHEEAGRYDDAISLLRRVADDQRSSGSYEECVKTSTLVGKLLIRLRRYPDAVITMQNAVNQCLQGVDSTSAVAEEFYDVVADAYYRKGDALASLRYQRKIYHINLQKSSDPVKMQDLHRVMGVLHLNTAQYIQSIKYFQKYLDVARANEGEHSLSIANAYNYMGIAYRHIGELTMARSYYEKAISLCGHYTRDERTAVSPSFTYVAPLYNNLGNIYCDEGNYSEAVRHFQLAINDIPPLAGDVAGMDVWFRNMGEALDDLGRFGESLVWKQRAEDLLIRSYGREHFLIAKNSLTIGDTYLRMGEFGKARKIFQQALQMTASLRSPRHPQTASAYMRLARAESGLGNVRKALSHCQAAFAVLVPGFDTTVFNNPPPSFGGINRGTLIEIFATKTRLLLDGSKKTGDQEWLTAAWQTANVGIQLSRMFRLEITDRASRTTLAENLRELYVLALEATLARYQQTGDRSLAAFALKVMEQNKSGMLIEAIQDARSLQHLGIPDSLLDLEGSFRKEVARCEQGILDENVSDKGADSTRVADFRESLFKAQHSLTSLVNRYKEEFPSYFLARHSGALVSLNDLQQKLLESGDRFVEFFVADTCLYVLSADRVHHNFQRIGGAAYGDLKRVLAILKNRNSTPYHTSAYNLCRQLLPAMIGDGDDVKKLIIVPDGLLSSLPFEALPMSGAAGSPYLLARYAVNYQYSAAFMKHAREGNSADVDGRILAMAPEFSGFSLASSRSTGALPYAQEEVDAIMDFFPGVRYSGGEATEVAFRKVADRYSILHFATHAVIDTLNPDRSFLYLAAADSSSDGMLHAYELFNMKLNARMVTLSACNTAAGQWNEGEGAMSLARAFAYAGCPSMITSLWPAQDRATAELMTIFYKNLAQGMGKDEALRQAKLAYLEGADKITSHPYFWAGFIHIGDDLPVTGRFGMQYYGWGVLLLIFVCALAFLKIRERRNRANHSFSNNVLADGE